MSNIPVLLLRSAGTNCEQELAVAFQRAGGQVSFLHMNEVLARPARLREFAILGFPGGFAHGDDIASGRIFANQLVHHLADPLRDFVDRGGLAIGICNGFQILVKCGLLPGGSASIGRQTATLTHNASGRFQCEWVNLSAEPKSRCLWTKNLETLSLPIAHGEGKFMASDEVLDQLEADGQVALRYGSSIGNWKSGDRVIGGSGDLKNEAVNFPNHQITRSPDHQIKESAIGNPENPNGSLRAIAGVCDPTGRIFGLMPHPERFIEAAQAPAKPLDLAEGPGLTIIRNGLQAAQSA